MNLPHRPLPIRTLCGHTLPLAAPASTRRTPRRAPAPETLETLGEAVWTHAAPARLLVDELNDAAPDVNASIAVMLTETCVLRPARAALLAV